MLAHKEHGETMVEEVVSNNLVLLPSLRFARLYSTLADGKQVYLTTERQLVCEHGELSSTISFWTSTEKRCKAEGAEPPTRGGFTPSGCNCPTTEGLNGKVPDAVCTPCKPNSLFEYLEDAERITVKGREARRIPHVKDAAFVSTVGGVTCRHGASRRSLIKKQRATGESTRLPTCGCKLSALSLHTGLKCMRLGKFDRLRVASRRG